jgi:zinc D-Ala-D-Ala carboxypeptidase
VAEFHCLCRHEDCLISLVSVELVEGLEQVRAILEKPIQVLSGFRCQNHNADIGGVLGSKHLLGIAADVRVAGISPVRVAQAAKRVDIFRAGGIGVYDTFTHLDHRGSPARW